MVGDVTGDVAEEETTMGGGFLGDCPGASVADVAAEKEEREEGEEEREEE